MPLPGSERGRVFCETMFYLALFDPLSPRPKTSFTHRSLVLFAGNKATAQCVVPVVEVGSLITDCSTGRGSSSAGGSDLGFRDPNIGIEGFHDLFFFSVKTIVAGSIVTMVTTLD